MQSGKLVTDAESVHAELQRKAQAAVAEKYRDDVDRQYVSEVTTATVRGVNVTRLPEYVREQARLGVGLIMTVKAVREQTGWGLKDSKEFCELFRVGIVRPF